MRDNIAASECHDSVIRQRRMRLRLHAGVKEKGGYFRHSDDISIHQWQSYIHDEVC